MSHAPIVRSIRRALSDARDPWGRERLRNRIRRLARVPLYRVARLHRATLSRRNTVIAITGSLGKTTTMRLTRAMVGMPPASRGEAPEPTNIGAGMILTFLHQSPLRRVAVVEVGINKPRQMRRMMAALRPNVVVVTRIGRDHIGAFPGGIEQLRDEKAEAVRALPRGGHAILNGDDEHVRWMATQTHARVTWFGLDPSFDVYATEVTPDWPEGTALTVHAGGRAIRTRTQLAGSAMVYALLGATAAALTAGVDLPVALRRAAHVPPTAARLQAVGIAGGATLLRDDFKGTIDSFYNAAQVLSEVPAARRIAVIGAMDSPPKPRRAAYRAVGTAVGRVADRVIVVGIYWESYWPGLRDGGLTREQAIHVRTVSEAVEALRGLNPGEGDVVLIKARYAQKLGRVALAMQGRDVRCRLAECAFERMTCDVCPLLSREPIGTPQSVAGTESES